MIKPLFVIVSLLYAAQLYAWPADSVARECIAGSRWFELNRVYRQQRKELSPYVRDFARALTDDAFGRKRRAVESIKRLLRKHGHRMDSAEIRLMTFELARNQSMAGHYGRAARTLSRDANQLHRDYMLLYRQLAAYPMKIKKRGAGVEIPFHLDSIGPTGNRSAAVSIVAAANGRTAKYMLDTGSTLNIVRQDEAERLGLRLLPVHGTADADNCISTQLAIADTLRLGSLTIRNMPFAVVKNTEDTGEGYGQHLDHNRAILGLPLLEALRNVEIDFKDKVIRQRTDRDEAEPNLCYAVTSKQLLLQFRHLGEALTAIPDFGSSFSSLDSTYCARHESEVATAKKSHVVLETLGGTTRTTEHHIPDFDIRIGNTLAQTPVSLYTSLHFDNRLGMPLWTQFRKVIFNMEDMVLRVY